MNDHHLCSHETTWDGHAVRWYSVGEDDAPLTFLWHHGTPNIGEPPEPLFEASAERGVRWISFDRPGYGGSDRAEGRSIADVGRLTLAVADAAGAERFAVMGHSGGATHALGAAVVGGDRVMAAACVSGLAPYGAAELDWFTGMYGGGELELRTALQGGGELEALVAAAEFDTDMFTPADYAALEGTWRWFVRMAAEGAAHGMGGMVDDDLAYVAPWGVDVGAVLAPVLLMHGSDDRVVPVAHARWLDEHLPHSELWERPGAGHISALGDGIDILDWLVERSAL